MFQSGMREAESKQIRVPDVEPAVFRQLLSFIYSGNIELKGAQMAYSMLPLANQYNLEVLKDRCARKLETVIGVQCAGPLVVLAHLHDCADLKRACFDWIKREFAKFNKQENWELLKAHPDLMVDMMIAFYLKTVDHFGRV